MAAWRVQLDSGAGKAASKTPSSASQRIADVANALRSILVQAAPEERSDARRETGRQQRPIRLAGQHRGEHVRDFLPANARLPGQHLVEHRAERPDVAAFVDGFAARLFRAHVRGSAEQDAASGHHGGRRDRG